MVSLAERLGHPRRRQVADRHLRRPRPHPRQQRGHLRRAASRPRLERVAHGAVPVGPRRRRRLPGRRRRRAPHAQRRARHLPLGADHPLAEPARRRRRVPPHRGRRLGPRRPRRGAPRVPGPDRAGDRVGLRREPPHQPPRRAATPCRLLRRLPRARGRLRATAAPGRRQRGARRRLPVPPPRRRGGRGVPGPRRQRARRAPGGGWNARSSSSLPASPSSRCIRASTPTSCAPRAATTGPVGSRTTRRSAATRRCATS